MRLRCQQCKIDGYLQRIGNYYRIRHYKGLNPITRKSEFFYHQQSKDYVERILKEFEPNENSSISNNGQCSSVQCKTENIIEHKLSDLGLESGNRLGRSSSLVRTLALRAKGHRFKSGPAHQPFLFSFFVHKCRQEMALSTVWTVSSFSMESASQKA
jgi:hypothetical protein